MEATRIYVQHSDILGSLHQLRLFNNGNDLQSRNQSLELAIDHLEEIQHCLASFFEAQEIAEEAEAISILRHLYWEFFRFANEFENGPDIDPGLQQGKGRSKLNIDVNQVNGLKRMGFS